MKSLFLRANMLLMLLVMVSSISALAQKEISGVVYEAGEPKGGVEVSAQKGTSAYSDHAGKFTITLDDKCKYIKFTDLVSGKSKRLDLIGTETSPIRFSIDGSEIPELGKKGTGKIDMRSQAELVKAGENKYLEQLTMYDQACKHNNYVGALPHWRVVYNQYPKSSLNVYIQGVTIYKNIAANVIDYDKLKAYVDTIGQIYQQRIEMFGNEGFVLGRKASDYFNAYANQTITDEQRLAMLKEVYFQLEKSINLTGKEAEPAVMVLYMGISKSLFRQEQISKEDVVKNYGNLTTIVDELLLENATDEKYLATKEEIDKAFQTSGAADCESLLAYYTPKFNEISSDAEALKKMLRALDRQNCTDSKLYSNAAEAMYSLSPTPEAAYNMALLYVKKDMISEAKDYYKKAIDGETDKELLGKYYYQLALITYAKEQSFSQAKNYAKQAITNDPKSGRNYILLGDIYAQGAKTYSSENFERSKVYWVAVDYYAKAKSVEPDIADEANRKIGTYSVYFPDKETLFFQGLNVGQTTTIGGWINETTRVRAK